MPYTHTTLAALKAALAQRLGDSGKVHWVDLELGLSVTEALRTYSLMSGLWRARGLLPTVLGTAFYDLSTAITLTDLVGYSVTDRDVIGLMQYMLTEPYDPIDGTGMSDQFTFADLVSALQRARNQLIDDTFVTVDVRSILVDAGDGLIALPESVMTVRRAVWKTTSGRYSNVHAASESTATFLTPSYPQSPGTPELYSLVASPVTMLRLIPPPSDKGTLELITVESQADLAPANSVMLNIPDDAVWIARELAMADLLGRDGPAHDPTRAEFCRSRYDFGVSIVNLMQSILVAEINGQPVVPSTLHDLDCVYGDPHWQSAGLKTPTDIGVIGGNLIAVRPVPNGIYSIALDLVTRAEIPADDGTAIQLGREQIDAVLDGAESYCLFKMGGQQLSDCDRLFSSMVGSAARYNAKLSVHGYRDFMTHIAQADSDSRPERAPMPRQGQGQQQPSEGGRR